MHLFYSHAVSQYSIEVSTSFSSDGSDLFLNCTVINGANLQSGQELVWTEGGIEIQEGTIGYSLHQSNTSSLLTISITHGLQYGEYGCQCHNRHSYTHNSLSKLIVTGSFIQHCSNKTTIIAGPQTSEISVILYVLSSFYSSSSNDYHTQCIHSWSNCQYHMQPVYGSAGERT